LDLGGILLKYASAQPICRLETSDGPLFVFTSQPGIDPEFCLQSGEPPMIEGPALDQEQMDGRFVFRSPASQKLSLYTITTSDRRKTQILILSLDEAQNLWKGIYAGRERLFLSSGSLIIEDHRLRIQASQADQMEVGIFPSPDQFSPEIATTTADGSMLFSRIPLFASLPIRSVQASRVSPAQGVRLPPLGPAGVAQAPEDADFESAEVWQVTLPPDALEGIQDAVLRIDYIGDAARAYLGDRLIDDDFYHGRPWEIAIVRFCPEILTQPLVLKLLPLHARAPIYLPELYWPDFQGQPGVVRVNQITLHPRVELEIRPENAG
jgi:beta-galactosidase